MSDTQNIDDKKNNNNGDSIKDKATEMGKFLITTIILVSMVIFYFSLGGVVLYACKLGQSNILPSDIKCFPYSDTKPEIEAIASNIFTTFTNPPMSAKLRFPYDKSNSGNMIIDLFRDYQKEPNASFLTSYFISIVEALVGINYWAINQSLALMNVLPESIIVLFGPIMAITMATLLLLFDNFYLMYLWFIQMRWFFRSNSNTSDSHPPEWIDVTLATPFYYCMSILLVILFVILFFVLLICLPVLPFITVVWCCLTCILFKSEINNKPASVFTVIKDMFKFYKVTIMAVSSACIVLSAFVHLGPLEGIVSIISLCLIVWGVVSINIFKSIKPEDLSALVSDTQAKKSCSVKAVKGAAKAHWFPLIHWLFSSQKGGKQLTSELKKLGNNLKQPEIELK